MIHIRKQIIISSIGISFLCSISTNFCMEENNISVKDKVISVGLEFGFALKKAANEFVNGIKKDLQNPTTENKNLVGQTTSDKLKIKKIAEKIDAIKWPPQQQKKITLVLEALQLIEEYKKEFNMTELEIGQKIYYMQPLRVQSNNKRASIILDIIRHSKQHQSEIKEMYKTREKYLVGEINNFYTPPGSYVMREADEIVEYNADALYKTEQ